MSVSKARRNPSGREIARRRHQSATDRRASLRDAKRRQRQRDGFAERGRRVLGTEDAEIARLTLAANPQLAETLSIELDGIPGRLRGADATALVYGNGTHSVEGFGEALEHFSFDTDERLCMVDLDAEARKSKRDADIDKAVISGDWSDMAADAAVMLAASKAVHEWKDTGKGKGGGTLTNHTSYLMFDGSVLGTLWPDNLELIDSAAYASALCPEAEIAMHHPL